MRGGSRGGNGSIAGVSRARVIPAVDHLLGLPAVQALTQVHGARRVRQVLDEEVTRLRAALIAGQVDAASRDLASAWLVQRLDATLTASRAHLSERSSMQPGS